MKGENTKKLVFTATFAALCCVATRLITIPIPGGFGYVNFGDIFVLMAAWCLGFDYGAVAAGVGSALADVTSGYFAYAPATFVIKAAMAVVGYFTYALFKKPIKRERLDFLPRTFAAVFSELVMTLGYFVFEWILYGFATGVVGIPFNLLQGGCATVCVVALVSALYPVPVMRKIFPALKRTV